MNPDADLMRRIVERRPYDFLSVDSQHAPFSEERLVRFCDAAATIGVPVLFRIKHTRHTYLVGNYLDLGPTAIEVPQVETQATVDEAVGNFYYPPRGVRSWGGTTRLAYNNQPLRQYIDYWEQTGALAMQIESVASSTAARSLAREGVDFMTFGPADLTLSLECHPNHALQSVDDCVRYVVRELEGTGVQVCMRTSKDEAARYHEMGVTMILEPGVK